MDQKLKERLVGATVISALVVIFVPMFFEESVDGESAVAEIKIPAYPAENPGKTAPVIPAPKTENSAKIDETVGKLVDDEKLPDAPTPQRGDNEVSPPTLPTETDPRAEFESENESSASPEFIDDGTGYLRSEPAPASDPAIENDSVDKDAKPNAGLSAWMIQVGSFELEENANEMRDMLRNEGFTAFVEAVESEKENFFRVRVGPELDRGRAEVKLKLMQKRFGLKGMIVSYPS